MSNKRIRIKKAKKNKYKIIKNHPIELANILIKIHAENNLIKKMHYISDMKLLRQSYILKLLHIDNIIKTGRNPKIHAIISRSENEKVI